MCLAIFIAHKNFQKIPTARSKLSPGVPRHFNNLSCLFADKNMKFLCQRWHFMNLSSPRLTFVDPIWPAGPRWFLGHISRVTGTKKLTLKLKDSGYKCDFRSLCCKKGFRKSPDFGLNTAISFEFFREDRLFLVLLA